MKKFLASILTPGLQELVCSCASNFSAIFKKCTASATVSGKTPTFAMCLKTFSHNPLNPKVDYILPLPSHGQMRRGIEIISCHSSFNCSHLLNECPCFLSYHCDILNNKLIIDILSWAPDKLLTFTTYPVLMLE